MKEKKVPMRKCTGCSEMKPKSELIRIVKNSEGEVSLDPGGKSRDAAHTSADGRNALHRPGKQSGLKRRSPAG